MNRPRRRKWRSIKNTIELIALWIALLIVSMVFLIGAGTIIYQVCRLVV